MSKPRLTTVIVERLHTLLVIGSGIAVGVPVMFWVPNTRHSGINVMDLVQLMASLAAAYLTAFLTDTVITFAIRLVRARRRSATVGVPAWLTSRVLTDAVVATATARRACDKAEEIGISRQTVLDASRSAED